MISFNKKYTVNIVCGTEFLRIDSRGKILKGNVGFIIVRIMDKYIGELSFLIFDYLLGICSLFVRNYNSYLFIIRTISPWRVPKIPQGALFC